MRAEMKRIITAMVHNRNFSGFFDRAWKNTSNVFTLPNVKILYKMDAARSQEECLNVSMKSLCISFELKEKQREVLQALYIMKWIV